MIKHNEIIKIYNEIKNRKNQLKNKEMTSSRNIHLEVRNNYSDFYNEYPKLFNKILNNNLDKFIPKMIKVHKNKKSHNFSRSYPKLHDSIKKGKTLEILKEVKLIKNELEVLNNKLQNDT